jgi:hypothetical protein
MFIFYYYRSKNLKKMYICVYPTYKQTFTNMENYKSLCIYFHHLKEGKKGKMLNGNENVQMSI